MPPKLIDLPYGHGVLVRPCERPADGRAPHIPNLVHWAWRSGDADWVLAMSVAFASVVLRPDRLLVHTGPVHSDLDRTYTTPATDDGRREETDDSFDSDASDRRPPRWSVDVGPFALGRGWAPAPTPSGELGRRHTSPDRPTVRHTNGAAPGDGVSDSSETDEEASAIARWLTYRRSVEEEERRTSARPIVERAVAEEQAIESHV